MPDIFLYTGQPNASDIKLSDPTVLRSAGAYSLAVDPGSFVFDGIAASLTRGLEIVPEIGSFALTGQNVALLQGHRLSVDNGSFACAGVNASLFKGSIVVGGVGAFTLTGQTVSLLHGHRLSADAGAFALTVSNAAIFKGSGVFGDVGSFTVTGTSASLLKGSLASVQSDAFALTGTDAELTVGHTLVADSGAFGLSGSNAALSYTPTQIVTIPVFTGSWMPLPDPPPPLVHYTLNARSGRFTLRGTPATLWRDGSVSAIAQTTSFHAHLVLSTSPAAIEGVGGDLQARITRRIAPQSGSFGVAVPAAALTRHQDAMAVAWLELQRQINDEDELLLLGVFDR